MHRTPNAPNPLIVTCHHSPSLDPLQLLPTRVPKQLRLLQHLLLFYIPDANGFFSAVDVGTADDGMFVWAWRDAHFDLGVLGCKGGEDILEEGAGGKVSMERILLWRKELEGELGIKETDFMPLELPAQSQ